MKVGSDKPHEGKPSGISKRRKTAKTESNGYYNERRKALVEAAAALFIEKGFKNTSLDDVARRIGADRASLYYYVASKQELFFEVVHDAVKENLRIAEIIFAGSQPPADKLRALIVALMDSYDKNYPHMQVFLQESLKDLASSSIPQSQSLTQLHDRFETIFKSIVQQGIREGSLRPDAAPTMVAYAILGMTNWTHRWFEPSGPLTGKEIGTVFANLIIDGALKRG